MAWKGSGVRFPSAPLRSAQVTAVSAAPAAVWAPTAAPYIGDTTAHHEVLAGRALGHHNALRDPGAPPAISPCKGRGTQLRNRASFLGTVREARRRARSFSLIHSVGRFRLERILGASVPCPRIDASLSRSARNQNLSDWPLSPSARAGAGTNMATTAELWFEAERLEEPLYEDSIPAIEDRGWVTAWSRSFGLAALTLADFADWDAHTLRAAASVPWPPEEAQPLCGHGLLAMAALLTEQPPSERLRHALQ